MPLSGWESVPRSDPAYRACLVAAFAGGGVLGSAVGSLALPVAGTGAGFVGGLAVGFAFGYLACPYVSPGIKRKFELGAALSDAELRASADAMSLYANVTRAPDVLRLLAISRHLARSSSKGPVCQSPSIAARQPLAT